MRLFISILLGLSFFKGNSQNTLYDSLSGFDFSKAMREAHLKNFFGNEAKVYLHYSERDFLINKYQLAVNPSTQVNSKKYSTNQVANLPCLNEDFESVATGPLPLSSSGWTVTEAMNNTMNTVLCGQNLSFTTPTVNNNAIVVATPYTDANCNHVPNSPFGGSNVIQLNKNNQSTTKITKIAQTFNVTMTNWFYKYAYKGVFYAATHGCCSDPVLMIRFFDCSNNLISSISHTVVPEDETCVTNSFSCGLKSSWPWVGGITSSAIRFTPNWVVEGVNLSQYIGSCVTVEVLAANCTGAAHQGYCYFDSECSSTGGISVNGLVQSSLSFTSCAPSATLVGLPCFNNYSWQGPSTSSVSGFTNSVIITNVPGTYTLVANSGTISSTQIITVNFVTSLPTVSISSTSQIGCVGNSFTLTANASGAVSYLWNTLVTTSSLTTPSLNSNAVYSVTVTDANGCTATDIKTITVQPPIIPIVSIIPTNSILCLGQSSILTANNNGVISYTWSTGANTPTIAISPTSNNMTYSVTVTNSLGCSNSAFANFTVQSAAPIATTAQPSVTICSGQIVVLNAFGSAHTTFSWSTGATVSAIQVFPSVTTVYTVNAQDSTNQCWATAIRTVVVKPCLGILDQNMNLENAIEVFPNPASESFTIKAKTSTKVNVINDCGQIIEELNLIETNHYSKIISGLPKGIYIVRTENHSIKLIVK
ncbi:T9SS type A sorting domain-containing protein [Aurantibacillus circumpalustris]|uniref:T9SS type A sorting domain-containing protein n=1 Tax=Aurantibacillus circumpalustris TaxID=3036359 RepID=UPI00295AEDC9|nr:T9SS type A sorting domain-containing protein [Aurantibacillus circumpalustris]